MLNESRNAALENLGEKSDALASTQLRAELILQKRRNGRSRIVKAVGSILERLEARRLMSTVYVDGFWKITTDVAPLGGKPTTGDTVLNATTSGGDASISATFGVNAFSSLPGALSSGRVHSGDTVVVINQNGGYGAATDTADITIPNLIVEGWQAYKPGDTFTSGPNAGQLRQTILNTASYTIDATNVTVEGFDVVGANVFGFQTSSGSSYTITRNIFGDPANQNTAGIEVDGGIGTISNNTFNSDLTSIFMTGGTSTISGNTISNSVPGDTGIFIAGGSASISGSSITGETIGIELGTGAIASIDGVTLSNTTDLQLDAGANSVTVGSTTPTIFQGTNYINNRSAVPINATTDTFNVGPSSAQVAGTALTLTEGYAVEDRITDAVDATGLGFVRITPNAVYVTPNSYLTPATNDTGAISRAVSAATSGDTVYVQAGLFTDSVTIDKPLSLIGANNVNDPTNSGSRLSESIIQPGVSGASPYSGTHTFLVDVLSSNVTFAGFTLTGQNTSLSNSNGAALTQTGATPIYAQATEGIASFNPTAISDISSYGNIPSYANPSNVSIQNNIIQDLSYQGIDFGWGSTGNPTGGNTISHNLIQNIGSYGDEGDAVRVYNNFNADISHNQTLNTRMGIEYGNFSQPNTGSTGSIASNQIQARRRGILYNLTYGAGNTGTPVTGNTITAAPDDLSLGGSVWTGIYLLSQQGNVSTTFLNNSIDGAGSNYTTKAGVAATAIDSTASVSITGGSISNVTYGVWDDNNDPNGFTTATSNQGLTVGGVSISATGAGVYVHDTSSTIGVSANVSGGSITAPTGLLISGSQASASIGGTTIHSTTAGIDNEGGTVSVGSGVTITGGVTGVVINGATSAVSGNTLSNLILSGQTGNYITLGSGALGGATPTQIDATGVKFDGTLGSALVINAGSPTAFAAEDKITDYLDVPTVGYVELNASHVYVTQAGESATPGEIQRGVNVAPTNGTINVQAGTYVGNVSIAKDGISLVGPQAGQTVLPRFSAFTSGVNGPKASAAAEAIILPSVIAPTTSDLISLAGNAITINGFTLDGNNAALGGSSVTDSNGVSLDTRIAINNRNGAPGNNLNVEYNVIQNFAERGVMFYGSNTADYTGNSITQNLIRNYGFDSSGGYGVLIWINEYTTVSNNIINVPHTSAGATGIYVFNFNGGQQSTAVNSNTVSNNTITVGQDAQGIVANLLYNYNPATSSSSLTISNNTINADSSVVTGNDDTFAILADSIQAGAPLSITGNTIGANTVTNVTGAIGSGGQFDRGIALTNLTPGEVTVTGGTIASSLIGISVNGDNTQGTGPVSTSISGVSISGGNIGIQVNADDAAGGSASASISGVSITGATTGIAVTSSGTGGYAAQAQIGSGNSISGGTTGLLISGVNAAVAGNTLENLSFTGQTGNYITLASGAETGQTINATAVTFDGFTGATASVPQDFAIENKITDALDNATLGFVRIRAATDFVTQAAETDAPGAIERAVLAAAPGDTIIVEGGSFTDNVIVNKQLTLLGANAGTSGSGSRTTETTVKPAGNQNAVFTVSGTSGVTIDGFTIDGYTPTATGAALYSGDTANVAYDILTSGVSGITVQNNILKRAFVGFRGDGLSSGNTITNNAFDSIGNFDFGYAVTLRSDFYANVTNNVMTRVWTGVHINNFHNAGGPAQFNVSGNQIHDYAGGVLDWLQYGSATPLTLNNNQISVSTDRPHVPNNVGIEVVTLQGADSVSITNDSISGADYGVIVFNAPTSNTVTLGSTDSITGSKVAGVLVTDNLNFNAVGTTNFLAGGPGAASTVNLSGVSITGATGSGVVVDATGGTATSVTVTGETITGSGGVTGVAVNGALASASVSGSTISGFATGIQVNGGSATITNNTGSIFGNTTGIDVNGGTATITGNHIYNNITGISIENGGAATVTGNDFTGTTPNGTDLLINSTAAANGIIGGVLTGDNFGGSSFFIKVGTAQNLDATGATFNGITSAASTLAQNYGYEDKIVDYLDNPSLGYVKLDAAKVYVAASSEAATVGAIQRGVNVAPVSGTVNVQAGTFAGPVTLGAPVTLLGAGSTVAGTILTDNSASGLTIAANNVTAQGLRITGNGSQFGIYFNSAVDSTSLNDIVSTGQSTALEIHNSAVVTNLSLNQVSLINSGNGFRVGTTGVVNGMNVTASHFDNDSYGFYINANTSSGANNEFSFTNINVSNSTFSNDTFKGIYAEELNNATFDGITVNSSGTGASSPNGVNLNLKYGTYNNITIKNSTFDNNANGVAGSGAIDIEGRNTGAYLTHQGSIAGLTLTNDVVNGTIAGATSPIDLVLGGNLTGVTLSGLQLKGTGGLGLQYFGTTALGLANTSFASSLTGYIVDNGTTGIDATSATFGGFSTATGTVPTNLPQFYATEDKIVDAIDVPTFGLVRLLAGNTFVTPNSFYSPAGTTSASIQRGADAATAGDTVNVEEGSFSNDVTVTKTLNFRGAQADVDARTRGTGHETVLTSADGLQAFAIEADNVTINGFTIQGVNVDQNVNSGSLGAGIWMNPGEYASDQGGAQILNNIIQNNIIGIALNNNGTYHTTVQHNLIQNNNQSGAGSGNAIETDFGLSNATIDSNSIVNASSSGITVQAGGPGITVSNNTADGEFYFYGLTGGQITGNTITNSSGGGIVLGGLDSGVSITNNEVHGVTAGFAALRLRLDVAVPSSSLTVANNIFDGGAGYGVRAGDGSYSGTLVLHSNEITGSLAAIENDDATNAIDAAENYFGSSVPSTVAAEIIGNVNFEPILTNGDTAPATIGFQADTAHLTVDIGGSTSVNEGAPYTLNLAPSNTSSDGTTITSWTINWGDGSTPQVVSEATPVTSITHTYLDGPNSYTISATAVDELGRTATSNSIALTVNNVAPVAVNDTNSMTEDTSSVNGNVLTNDSDVGSSDTIAVVSPTYTGTRAGTYGTLVLNVDGSYTYTLNTAGVQHLAQGDSVVDVFGYKATDGTDQSNLATLTVTIYGTNDAPVAVNDTASATEAGGVANATAGVNPSGNVLTNDTDVDDGDTKTVASTYTGTFVGTYGTLVLNTNGSYTYTVDNDNPAVQALRQFSDTLTESFSYQAQDALGALSNTANLVVTIHGANDAPVANNDTASATEAGGVANATAGVNPTGNVLTNDTDVDSNGETIAVHSAGTFVGTYGTLVLNVDGSYTYTVDNNNPAVQALRQFSDTLTESFSYQAQDALGALSNTANLVVTIHGANDAPVANNDTASATEAGGVANATAGVNPTGNVLTNDTDVDSNGETIAVHSAGTFVGTYGTLVLNVDGSYTYTVDNNNPAVQALRQFSDTLTESFSYQAQDALGALSNTANLVVTIHGANDAPVANNDTASATEAGGVANATAGVNPSGNVLTNDTDVDSNGETIAVHSAGTFVGTYGTLVLNVDGSYTYTVDNNNPAVQALRQFSDTLTESFSYQAQDALGALSNTANLVVTIHGANDAPVANNDTASATEAGGVANATAGVNPSGNVLTNDTDVDSNGETIAVHSAGTFVGTYGTLVLNVDGSYTYTVDNNNPAVQALRQFSDTLTESFSYQAQDALGALSNTANLVVTIHGANDAPVANNDTASATEAGGTANATAGVNPTGNVLTNDTDVDTGDTKTVSAGSVGTRVGTYGTLVLNADGSYTYTVDNNNATVQALQVGASISESFNYTMFDTAGAISNVAALTVTIHGANDAPVTTVTNPTVTVNEGQTASNAGTFTDVDSAAVTVTSSVGTITQDSVHGAWTWHYNTTDGPDQSQTVTITSTDSQGATSQVTFSLVVNNVAPTIAISGNSSVSEGSPYALTLGTVTDPGTDTVSSYIVHWGDGSSDTYSSNGVKTHAYADGPNNYAVTVDLVDEDGTYLNVANALSVAVNNVPPTLTLSGASNVNEGATYSLTLASSDPGDDTVTNWQINWGDGSAVQTITAAPRTGTGPYATSTVATHVFLDGPHNYTISAKAFDEDNAVTGYNAGNTVAVAVADVAPTVTLTGSQSDNTSPANDAEGSTFTLTFGPVVDPGYAGGDRVTDYFINWGDGTPVQDVAVADLPETGGTVTHVYDNGTVPQGTTTPTDLIKVNILDNNGLHNNAGQLGVVVFNVNPTATFDGDTTVAEGTSGNVVFFGATDPSAADRAAHFKYAFDFTGTGTAFGTPSSSPSASVPASFLSTPGNVTILGRVYDIDGGFTQYSHVIAVTNVAPTVNPISNVNVFTGTVMTVAGGFSDPGNDAPWLVYANYDAVNHPGLGMLIQTGSSKSFTLSNTYTTPGTYTVQVTVVDLNGGAGSLSGTQTFTVVATSPAFAVSSFTANPSGFDVTFNRPLDTSSLNLYKGTTNTYGAADITLTGPSGPVTGSFVYDSSTNTGHFIKTGGVLGTGSYTATLFTGSSAIKDSSGNPLAAGNFTGTFSIGAVGDVVSVPDFVRGPGQSVNLPASSSTGLPLSISDGTNVTAVDFTLNYNPSLLSITSISLAAGLPSGWTFAINGSSAGQFILSVYGTTNHPLSAGVQTLLNLTTSVPGGARYGAASEVTVTAVTINGGIGGIVGTGDAAVEKVAYIGNASGANGGHSTGYDPFDAYLISQVVVHNASGFDAYPLIDPTIIGNVTHTGTLSGQDASEVLSESIGLLQSDIPTVTSPVNATGTQTGLDPTVSMPSNVLVNRNESLLLPVNISTIDSSQPLVSASFTLVGNLSKYSIDDVTIGDLNASGWLIQFNPANNQVGLFGPGVTGAGSIAKLHLTIAANAATGVAPVTISTGNLNELQLPLTLSTGSVDIEVPSAGTAYTYYGGSSYDIGGTGSTPQAIQIGSDWNAIATDKSALVAGTGNKAGFVNVTSYTRGLNGLLIDFPGMLAGNTVAAGDFQFAVGVTGTTWSQLGVAPTIIWGTDPVNGQVMADLSWPSGTILNEWLQVTVLNETFYYGNLVGSTGSGISPTRLRVQSGDLSSTQTATNTRQGITGLNDFDRNGRVQSGDLTAVQSNVNQASLTLFTVSAPPAPRVASALTQVAPTTSTLRETASSVPLTPGFTAVVTSATAHQVTPKKIASLPNLKRLGTHPVVALKASPAPFSSVVISPFQEM